VLWRDTLAHVLLTALAQSVQEGWRQQHGAAGAATAQQLMARWAAPAEAAQARTHMLLMSCALAPGCLAQIQTLASMLQAQGCAASPRCARRRRF
jgi:hypothetical protein